MKREFKFRGKRIDNAAWIIDSETYICDGDGTWLSDNKLSVEKVMPDTVGQFTGLYDKNEKEIYEGDILRIFRTDTDESLVVEVYDKGIVNIAISEYDYVLLDLFSTYCEFEVIGNIYDNHELLERKDEE